MESLVYQIGQAAARYSSNQCTQWGFTHLSGEGCSSYVSCPASFLPSFLPSLSLPLDLNCKLVIAVVNAGPSQQPLDQSDPSRTSSASQKD